MVMEEEIGGAKQKRINEVKTRQTIRRIWNKLGRQANGYETGRSLWKSVVGVPSSLYGAEFI